MPPGGSGGGSRELMGQKGEKKVWESSKAEGAWKKAIALKGRDQRS